MQPNQLEYHPLIKPYANSFASVVGGTLGWRLLNFEEFEQLMQLRGGNDRVAFASEALKKEKKNTTFSLRGAIQPLVSGSVDHHRLIATISQQLLGHCWEILKHNNLIPSAKDAPKEIEFYRHIRNGSFHGNRFHFKKGEPRFTAKWRGLVIKKELEGKFIFRNSLEDSGFFLNHGDPLYLLADISKLL